MNVTRCQVCGKNIYPNMYAGDVIDPCPGHPVVPSVPWPWNTPYPPYPTWPESPKEEWKFCPHCGKELK